MDLDPDSPDLSVRQPALSPDSISGDEQLGGGRRLITPPPIPTPTRLRTKVRATERDTGLVRAAGTRRTRFLQNIADNPQPGQTSLETQETERAVGISLPCANVLFTNVPSQSPYLTCKASFAVQEPKHIAGTTSSNDAATTNLQPSEPEACMGVPAVGSPGSSPTRNRAASVIPANGCHPPVDSNGASPAFRRCASAIPAYGLPGPRTPQTPPLLDLKGALAEVHAKREPRILPAPQAPPLLALEEALAEVHAGRGQPSQLADVFAASTQDDDSGVDRVVSRKGKQTPHAQPPTAPHQYDATEIDLFTPQTFEDTWFLEPESPTPDSRTKGPDESLGGPSSGMTASKGEAATVNAVGRTPAHVSKTLQDGFTQIHNDFSQLANRVGLPFQNVLNRFMRQFSRACTSNLWNSYQKFHAANKEQEVRRLGEYDFTASTSVQTMRACYTKFQEAYLDKWQNILSDFDDAENCNDEGKSVGHRQALFARLAKNLCQGFNTMAKAHAFEAVMLMAGSVVNQDASMGVVYASPGAAKFFQVRCHYDDDEILGHFKAHVYNAMSLANVTLALEGLQGESSTMVVDAVPSDEVEIVETGKNDDHARIRGAFVQALTKLGCQWARCKLFPWKTLPLKLASSGVVCHNYPDSVPFPGEERLRCKGGSKGVSDLTMADCATLIAALSKSAKEGLYFDVDANNIPALRASKMPVIMGAPPEPDSVNAFGKRMFANGRTDRKGPPQLFKHVGIRIKKKKKPLSKEVIEIADSDGELTHGKGKGKAREQPPLLGAFALSDSEEVEVSAPTIINKRTLPRRDTCRAAKPADAARNDLSDVIVQDISSPSGSEFKAGADSGDEDEEDITTEDELNSDLNGKPKPRQRRRVGRPQKPRVIVEVPPAKYKKEKGLAPRPPAKRSHEMVVTSSSDEQAVGVHEESIRIAKRKRTNDAPSNDNNEAPQGPASTIAKSEKMIRVRPKPRLVTKGNVLASQEANGGPSSGNNEAPQPLTSIIAESKKVVHARPKPRLVTKDKARASQEANCVPSNGNNEAPQPSTSTIAESKKAVHAQLKLRLVTKDKARASQDEDGISPSNAFHEEPASADKESPQEDCQHPKLRLTTKGKGRMSQEEEPFKLREKFRGDNGFDATGGQNPEGPRSPSTAALKDTREVARGKDVDVVMETRFGLVESASTPLVTEGVKTCAEGGPVCHDTATSTTNQDSPGARLGGPTDMFAEGAKVACGHPGTSHSEGVGGPWMLGMAKAGNMATPQLAPQVGADRTAFPQGWYGAPGMGAPFARYGGPFFGPYGPWRMLADGDGTAARPGFVATIESVDHSL